MHSTIKFNTIFSEGKRNLDRIVATIAFIFTSIMIILNICYPTSSIKDVLPKIGVVCGLIIIDILFLIIIIKPDLAFLFLVGFIIQGMISLIDGEMTIGLIFILLSIGVAVRYGLFRKDRVIKLIIYAIIVIGCVCIHSSFFPEKIIRNLLEVILYAVFIFVVYLMFRNDLESYFSTRRKKSLTKDFKLSEREAVYVLGILEGKMIKDLASDNCVTDSCVKTSLHRAYKKMQIEDARQLVLMAVSIKFVA